MVRLNRALTDTETLRSKAGSGIFKCGSHTRTEAPYAYEYDCIKTKKTEKFEPPFMVRTPPALPHDTSFEKILAGTDPSARVRRLLRSPTPRTPSTALRRPLRYGYGLSSIHRPIPDLNRDGCGCFLESLGFVD